MHNNLIQVINLVKQTGDRIIFIDGSNQSDVFVILNLKEYEKIVLNRNIQTSIENLTDQKLVDKINQNIALLKNESDTIQLECDDKLKLNQINQQQNNKQQDNELNYSENLYNNQTEDNQLKNYYKDNEEKNFNSDDKKIDENGRLKKKLKKNLWSIPSERQRQFQDHIIDEREVIQNLAK